jgi:hypothetical protein
MSDNLYDQLPEEGRRAIRELERIVGPVMGWGIIDTFCKSIALGGTISILAVLLDQPIIAIGICLAICVALFAKLRWIERTFFGEGP